MVVKFSESAKDAVDWLKEHGGEVVKFIVHLVNDPKARAQLGADVKNAVVTAAKGMARTAGASVAKAQVNFMSAPAFEQGEMMGKLVGYLIPEILLAVFSGTIGTWIKAGITAFKNSRLVVKAIKSARWLIDLGKQLFKSFGKIAEKIADIAEGAFKAVGDGFKKLLEFVKGLMKWEDELPEGALGKTDDVADLGKKERKLKEFDKVNDTEKKKLKGEAEKDAKEGGMDKEKDYDDKMAALLEAKAITAAYDKVEPSVHPEVLIKTLEATIKYKGISFYYDPVATTTVKKEYVIWMQGCTVRIGKYDIIIPPGFKQQYKKISGYEEAHLGTSTSSDYRKTFTNAFPKTEGKVWVHHAIEQDILERYPGLITESEMHSLQNLRGIPNDLNARMHLSAIRKEWNRFYREFPKPTKRQLLNKATEIDNLFGHLFDPPIR